MKRRPRVIPCLLLHRGGLVKTVRFKSPRYLGDPINTVRILNDKEVDELILLDIDATVEGREPDYARIRDIASECFMPLSYGGGVRTLDQVVKLISLGIEKVSLSSAALETPRLVEAAARVCGSSSVVVTLDVKRKAFTGRYALVTRNGKRWHDRDPVAVAKEMRACGAGELIVNCVDRDGMMQGYDESLIQRIVAAVSIPVVALGGAGNLDHVKSVIVNAGAAAAAASSIFVYQGVHRAVLISYPSDTELRQLFAY